MSSEATKKAAAEMEEVLLDVVRIEIRTYSDRKLGVLMQLLWEEMCQRHEHFRQQNKEPEGGTSNADT